MKTILIFCLILLSCNKSPTPPVVETSQNKEELRKYLFNKIGGHSLAGYCFLACTQGNPRDSINKAAFSKCFNRKSMQEEIEFMKIHGKSPYEDTINELIEDSLKEWATSPANIDKVLGTMKD